MHHSPCQLDTKNTAFHVQLPLPFSRSQGDLALGLHFHSLPLRGGYGVSLTSHHFNVDTCDMAGTQRWLAGREILRTGCCQQSEQWVYVGLMLLSAVTGFYNFRSLFTFILFAGLANMTALCF